MTASFLPILALVAIALAAPPASEASEPLTIRWSLAAQSSERVSLRLAVDSPRTGDRTAVSLPTADLQGLAPGQLSAASSMPARFRIVREAGRLDCTGSVGEGRGSGACRFTGDAAFAAELERRGVGRPRPREQLALTLHGANVALLNELDRLGYRRPTVGALIAAGVFHIDIPWLRSLQAAGYRAGSVNMLIAMKIFRVDADWIVEMASLGPRFRDLSADTLVAMRVHRITPEFARRMQAQGHADLTPERLIQLRLFGGRTVGRRDED